MFRIGEFSKMAKTTIKTLRHYDEVDLLKPATTDDWTGYRLYTTDQLFVLHQIQAYRQIGLSVPEIKVILAGNAAEPILQKRRNELHTELSEASLQLSRLDWILNGKQEEWKMNYAATIKEIPACTVYTKTLVAPDYNAYFSLIPAIGQQMAQKYPTLKCTAPEYCFVRYLDGEYREKDIRIEFCEAVEQKMPDFEDIVFKTMPAITAVSVMHKGPYTTLSQAYAFAFEWLEQNGYVPCEVPRESYIDGIWNKEDAEQWLTELQIPIAKK